MQETLLEPLRRHLVASGASEEAATKGAVGIAQTVIAFVQSAAAPWATFGPTVPATLARFAKALDDARAAFEALDSDARRALSWEARRPARRGLFGSAAPARAAHEGAQEALLRCQSDLAILAECAHSVAPLGKRRRGRSDSGGEQMFVRCIQIWKDATGAWPVATKHKVDGDALAPLFKEIDALLRLAGADDARLVGTGSTTFLAALGIAKEPGSELGGLFALGAHAQRKAEMARKRKMRPVANSKRGKSKAGTEKKSPATRKPTNRG